MYIERQQDKINILEKRFSATPEKIGDKFNPRYFALKALIAKEKKALEERKSFEYLAQ